VKEAPVADRVPEPVAAPNGTAAAVQTPIPEPASKPVVEPVPEAGQGVVPAVDDDASGAVELGALDCSNWHRLLAGLGLTGIVQNIASHCELRSNQGGALSFVLDSANATLFNDSHEEKVRLALENYFGQPVRVSIELGSVSNETPAMRHTRKASERQQQAVDSIENDPRLQALMSRFDGELDRSSIVPTDA